MTGTSDANRDKNRALWPVSLPVVLSIRPCKPLLHGRSAKAQAIIASFTYTRPLWSTQLHFLRHRERVSKQLDTVLHWKSD